MLQAEADGWVQRTSARLASFGEANAEPGALIPGSRPDLLLIKQVDQVYELNGRLLPAGGSPGSSPHCRHHVFGAGSDAGGPACRHNFD
jgi:hypothetical protein